MALKTINSFPNFMLGKELCPAFSCGIKWKNMILIKNGCTFQTKFDIWDFFTQHFGTNEMSTANNLNHINRMHHQRPPSSRNSNFVPCPWYKHPIINSDKRASLFIQVVPGGDQINKEGNHTKLLSIKNKCPIVDKDTTGIKNILFDSDQYYEESAYINNRPTNDETPHDCNIIGNRCKINEIRACFFNTDAQNPYIFKGIYTFDHLENREFICENERINANVRIWRRICIDLCILNINDKFILCNDDNVQIKGE